MAYSKNNLRDEKVYFENEPSSEGIGKYIKGKVEVFLSGSKETPSLPDVMRTMGADLRRSVGLERAFRPEFNFKLFGNEDSKGNVIELEPYIEDFPKDVDFDVVIHRGAHQVDATEEYSNHLKDKTKAAWVILAKGLDLDVKDFPQEEVDFWAPTREKLSGSNIRALDKAREIYYRRRYFPKKFASEVGGEVKRSRFSPTKSSLHLPIESDGDFKLDLAAHELFHSYLTSKGIVVSQKDVYGKIINEGLGTIGNYIPAVVEEGKIPMISVSGSTDENFQSFRASIEHEEKDNRLEDKAYDPANTLLHWYLVSQRGGLMKMRELTKNVKLQIDERIIRRSLIDGYEKTYGEPLLDLVDKAESWYKEQTDFSADERT